MKYVRPKPFLIMMLPYLAGGAAIGFGVSPMKVYSAAHFGRPGYAVAFVINVAMPALVVAMAAIYPSWRTALVGTFLGTLAFLFSAGHPLPRLASNWIADMIRPMGPILFVACLAYNILAAATVTIVRLWRRVGVPPDPRACKGCGYLLVGIASSKCPECGRPIT